MREMRGRDEDGGLRCEDRFGCPVAQVRGGSAWCAEARRREEGGATDVEGGVVFLRALFKLLLLPLYALPCIRKIERPVREGRQRVWVKGCEGAARQVEQVSDVLLAARSALEAEGQASRVRSTSSIACSSRMRFPLRVFFHASGLGATGSPLRVPLGPATGGGDIEASIASGRQLD